MSSIEQIIDMYFRILKDCNPEEVQSYGIQKLEDGTIRVELVCSPDSGDFLAVALETAILTYDQDSEKKVEVLCKHAR